MELGWLLVGFYGALAVVALVKVLPTFSRQAGMLASAAAQALARQPQLQQLERVQAVVMTLATAGLFGYWGGQNIAANSATLPDIPGELLTAYGASQAIYVAGKFARKRRWI